MFGDELIPLSKEFKKMLNDLVEEHGGKIGKFRNENGILGLYYIDIYCLKSSRISY
jgi:hypothetical protein